jgi:hypothetical protein
MLDPFPGGIVPAVDGLSIIQRIGLPQPIPTKTCVLSFRVLDKPHFAVVIAKRLQRDIGKVKCIGTDEC